MIATTTSADAAPATVHDPRWTAIVNRDRAADGSFYYSVATTGVYCRPSCASRLANPRNVRFHRTAEDAERAGFRPCRRCRPDRPPADRALADTIAGICRAIDAWAEMPRLSQLAARAGLSPHHFHRTFKALTGVTPRAYATAVRARRVRDALTRRRTVTDAIYEAGFGSSSRFYEASNAMLGMTAGEFRRGGDAATIRFAVGECSLGAILVASSARGICAISLGDDPAALVRDLQDRFARATLIGGDADFERIVGTVIASVETPATPLDLPLDVRGTAFQQRVWQALRRIPSGTTSSYAEIARRIGAPTSARAVAHACAANTLAVAIPCHRVVRTDGSLSGYRWGVERKKELLKRER